MICLVILSIFVIFAVIASLATNYYWGKRFNPCLVCPPNVVHVIHVETPNANMISCLYNAIRRSGGRLNPDLNFNNAKGKKLNAAEMMAHCPDIANYFMSEGIVNEASKIVGENVTFAEDDDIYRIFSRAYDDESDFLAWHYDNNFTKGNRYTLVIPLIVDDCNTAEFKYKDRQSEEEVVVKVPIGCGLLYNGTEVYHSISKQTAGCTRMVVIIPLYSNRYKGLWGRFREKLRNLTDKNLTL